MINFLEFISFYGVQDQMRKEKLPIIFVISIFSADVLRLLTEDLMTSFSSYRFRKEMSIESLMLFCSISSS